MIQRVQTIYLLLCLAFSVTGLFLNLGYFGAAGENVGSISNWMIVYGPEPLQQHGVWALGVILSLSCVLTAVSILLFHKRALQMRVVLFSAILLVGWCGLYGFTSYMLYTNHDWFRPTLNVALQPISIILLLMAFRAIHKDELLVQSLNRLR